MTGQAAGRASRARPPIPRLRAALVPSVVPARAMGFIAVVGAVLGGFSAPSLVTRALAPFGFALLMSNAGTSGALAGLMVVSLGSCAAYAAATLVRS